MINIESTVMKPGRFNNYIIAGNITGCFAVGEIGSEDDFYFVGVEPLEESPYPILSGNVLDSNGEILFTLIRNTIVSNPKNCYKIVGDYIGYEILDGAGKFIMKVETKFHEVPQLAGNYFYTTIKADFYNKDKQLVFKANSGEEDEEIKSVAKVCYGKRGIVFGYTAAELEFFRFYF